MEPYLSLSVFVTFLPLSMHLTLQELENPFILVHEKKISGLTAILPVLELALKVGGRREEGRVGLGWW